MKFTKDTYQFIYNKIPKLIKAGYTSKEISTILNISISSVMRACKKLGLSIPNYHNSLKFDNTVFDKIDTEEKAYWLGFLYADGNTHKTMNIINLSLSIKDYNHLVKYQSFLKTTTKIVIKSVKVNDKTYKACSLAVCDKHFKQRLIELGCYPNKSLILTFPNKSIFETNNLIYDFIRGYIDGDGCLTYSRVGKLAINIVGTKNMMESISAYFPNQFRKIIPIVRKNTVDMLSSEGKKAEHIANILYSKASIYLDRKYDRFCRLVK